MNLEVALVASGAFLLALFLTVCWERLAKSAGLMDVPNSRSSHAIPTPRGGGLAIVVSSLGAGAVLLAMGYLSRPLCVGLGGGGALVAAIGFIDDRRPLSATLRMSVHLVAGVWAIAWLGAIPFVGGAESGWWTSALDFGVSVLGIVWFLNIFNFMDGIDGIAASEAVVCCGGMALTGYAWFHRPGVAVVALVLGAAAMGFLPRNWPKAKIFLGDVGSGYLGFTMAAAAVAQSFQRPAAIWSWIVLVGVFAVDSGVTLIRRAVGGQALTVAHRTHAYQRLALRFGHRRVTTAVIGIDLFWLLPLALLGAKWPEEAWLIAVIALAPLVWLAVRFKAGVIEKSG